LLVSVLGRNFSATGWPVDVICPRLTLPKPPVPMTRSTEYVGASGFRRSNSPPPRLPRNESSEKVGVGEREREEDEEEEEGTLVSYDDRVHHLSAEPDFLCLEDQPGGGVGEQIAARARKDTE
jgi:hypothetical protein